MYKLITLSTLLLGLALAPVLGGNVEQRHGGPAQSDSPYVDGALHDPSGALAGALAGDTAANMSIEASACDWRCEPCEPDQGCTQTCTEIGNCGTTCNVIARCDVGYVWDEGSCSCVQ